MKKNINYILLMVSVLFLSCSEESQIEGLIYSNNATIVAVNETVNIVPNTTTTKNFEIKINNETYYLTFQFNSIQAFQNGSFVDYYLSGNITPSSSVRLIKLNNNVLYIPQEGFELNNDTVFDYSFLYFIQYDFLNNINLSYNSLTLNQDFYIAFKIEDPTISNKVYGWVKCKISNNNFQIYKYAYKINKSIKIGED